MLLKGRLYQKIFEGRNDPNSLFIIIAEKEVMI